MIAFDQRNGVGYSNIYVMNEDGTEKTRLTHLDSSWAAYPSWSHNVKKIAFRSYREGSLGIYVMNIDGSDEMRLTNIPQLDWRDHVWSPDGNRVAFSAEGGIYIVNVDGTGLRRLTNVGTDRNPSWSPDGARIAFCSLSEQNSSGFQVGSIYIINMDGTDLKRLTHDSTNARYPLWLPDGNSIVWIKLRPENDVFNGDIYVLNVEGGEYREIVSGFKIMDVGLSPDGDKISFRHYVVLYDYDLYTVRLDGTGLQKVNPENLTVDTHSWSSDGQKITFKGDRFGDGPGFESGIFTVHLDGSQLQYLGMGDHPQWSPTPLN